MSDSLMSGSVASVLEAIGGTPIVTNGEYTGALPGNVLRSGRDTDTVTP